MSKKHTVDSLIKKYDDREENSKDLLRNILTKKARGFVLEEISEEYSCDENDKLKLVKRKIISKEVAPDITAIKALTELKFFDDNKYKDMSYEELQKEKQKLLNLLSEEDF